MDNYEKLRESKIVYEYINDLLENGDFEIPDEYRDSLNKTMSAMADIYNNIHILMQDNKEERLLLNTDLNCPHCDSNVLISDLIPYAYVCERCDENYYLSEGDLNYEWYYNKFLDKLEEDVFLEISYDNNEKNLIIGTDSSSGAKYKCNNVSDFINAIESYTNNYLVKDKNETYYIEFWETENDREQGYGSKYLETYIDKDMAIKEAKDLIKRNGYSFVEVVKENPQKTIFCSDGITEEYPKHSKYYSSIYKVSPETLHEYVENWTNKKGNNSKYDLLYCKNNNSYVAVDNRSGDCFVEEFETEAQAVFWLSNNVEVREVYFSIIPKEIVKKVNIINENKNIEKVL